MKNAIRFIGVAGVLSLLVACSSGDEAASAKSKEIVGDWVCRDGAITTTYQFRDDGTCTLTVSLPPGAPPQDPENGTWKVDDSYNLQLTVNGREESYTVQVKDGKYWFAGGGGQVFVRGG